MVWELYLKTVHMLIDTGGYRGGIVRDAIELLSHGEVRASLVVKLVE